MYDSPQDLNKGSNWNMALMGVKASVAPKMIELNKFKIPEVNGCDSLIDVQTVDQNQCCTSGCDAVADTG